MENNSKNGKFPHKKIVRYYKLMFKKQIRYKILYDSVRIQFEINCKQ